MSNRHLFLRSTPAEPDLAGWMLRGGVALFFVLMGAVVVGIALRERDRALAAKAQRELTVESR